MQRIYLILNPRNEAEKTHAVSHGPTPCGLDLKRDAAEVGSKRPISRGGKQQHVSARKKKLPKGSFTSDVFGIFS